MRDINLERMGRGCGAEAMVITLEGLLNKRIESPLIMKRLFYISTLFAICTACRNNDDVDSFVQVEAKEYNSRIAEWTTQREAWTTDPVLITRKLFNNEGDPERKTVIDFESQANDKVRVTLTQEGLSDDSVYGEKRIIDFELINGVWTITQIRLGFRCSKSRGHTNYSGYLCS